MTPRRRAAAALAGAGDEALPAVGWILHWLTGGALATVGPLTGSVAVPLGLLAIVSANPGRFAPTDRRLLLALSTVTALAVAAFLLWFPHWWSWRVCGLHRWGRSLGAALWLAKLPSGQEGQSVRVLTASALCAGDFLGFGVADGCGLLALALQAARAGDGGRSALVLDLFRRQGRAKDPLARLVSGYALTAVAAAHLRAGQPALALAWTERARGRGARHLRLLARRRLAERSEPRDAGPLEGRVEREISPARYLLARLLSPYRDERRRVPRPAPAPARERVESAPALTGRLHLQLLADAAAGSLTPAPVERLARRWGERRSGEATEALLLRAADLADAAPGSAVEELEAWLRGDLALLAAAAQGEWTLPEAQPFGEVLRQGRSAPLRARLEHEMQAFLQGGEGVRKLRSSLVELDRWLELKLAAGRLVHCEGIEALSALWFGGLRWAACNWPVRLWNGEGERSALAVYEMCLWCADMAERLGDDEIADANQSMLVRSRRRLGLAPQRDGE